MRRALRITASLGVKPSPNLVIDSLLKEVGPNGTILFPLFNFDFPETKKFSMHTTPSQMGVITEFARNNYEGFRTGHPIYSFYAIGALASEFKNIDNKSGYGKDSPFAKLRDLDGKIAVIDLDDQNSMTFYHHVEEMNKVEYRFFKEFSGEYENIEYEKQNKSYYLFVRKVESGVITNVNPMGEILWNEGLYSGNRPGISNGLRIVSARKLYSKTEQIIQRGQAKDTLYSIE